MHAIGVFDSGLGGVSTLRQAMAALPGERFVYYGDSGNAPYGDRPEPEIRALTLAACRKLAGFGVKALLVACNTATAAALNALEAAFADIPVVGIRPAVEEAVEQVGEGRILMLATEATTRLPFYTAMHDALPEPARVTDIAGPAELVRRIERGVVAEDAFDDILSPLLAPYEGERIGGIVLGCTHYPFLLPALRRYAAAHFVGECRFFEGGAQSVEALRQALARRGSLCERGAAGGVAFHTSGDAARMEPLFHALLEIPLVL